MMQSNIIAALSPPTSVRSMSSTTGASHPPPRQPTAKVTDVINRLVPQKVSKNAIEAFF
jgi:hypothetical protein